MSKKLKLIIGNKNYSSWSLRPWILLRHFEIPFDEILIPLYEGKYKEQILKYSPNGKVPALVHDSVVIWESLAICQYLAELFPKKKMWPQDLKDRALAYSISQEMHAGFFYLRTNMLCNVRGRYPGKGMTPDSKKDIDRILEIWTTCRNKFKNQGSYLFGHFTVADAMFMPIVTRFRTYGVVLKGIALNYAETMLGLKAFKEWEDAAIKEPWVIKKSEIYNPKYK